MIVPLLLVAAAGVVMAHALRRGGGAASIPGLGALLGGNMTERQELIEKLRSLKGTPYVWGGTTPSGIDCSGLLMYCYNQIGISIPRQVTEQAETAPHKKDAQQYENIEALQNAMNPGDALGVGFDETRPHPVYGTRYKHVLIWTGEGWLHASSSRGVVEDANLSNGHFTARRKIYAYL